MNLKSDATTALRGVLLATRGPWLVLRNAQLLAPAGPSTIDGEVLVHTDNIDFLQVPPSSEA